jgi:hypothetical protein
VRKSSQSEIRAAADYVRSKLNHEGIRRLAAVLKGRRGRPPGSGAIDDSVALAKMADLIVAGKYSRVRPAAREVGAEVDGNSPKAVEDRLRRKYATNRSALEAAARARRSPSLFRPSEETLGAAIARAREGVGHPADLETLSDRIRELLEAFGTPPADPVQLLEEKQREIEERLHTLLGVADWEKYLR